MLTRLLRHFVSTRWQLRRRFSAAVLDAIEAAIVRSESSHAGELRVVIEAALDLDEVLAGKSARARAIETFAELRIGDTEQRSGVLIYLLYADHAIEIVADRGYNGRVEDADWRQLCALAEAEFAAHRVEQALAGLVTGVGTIMACTFPVARDAANELPDRPTLR